MLDTSIKVQTEQFDGPLGLLLLLIKKEEMDIRSLNLRRITGQYLDFLAKMQQMNFDVAGEYLFLASTLLLLKSKACLTEEESKGLQDHLGTEGGLNILTEADLIRRLEELQRFQRIGRQMWSLPRLGEDIFTRPKINKKAIIDSVLTPIDQQKLIEAMLDIKQREKRKYTIIRRDRLSIKEKLIFLKKCLSVGDETTLSQLLDKDGGQESTDNIVITFISLLELARLKRVKVFQNVDRGPVYVEVIKSLDDFDVTTADGFEEEGEEENQNKEDISAEKDLNTIPMPATEEVFTQDKVQ